MPNGEPYTPKARPLQDDPSFWQMARQGKELRSWLVLDTYEHIDSLVERFVDELDSDLLPSLHQIASWSKQTSLLIRYLRSSLILNIVFVANRQHDLFTSLYKAVIGALKNDNYQLEKKWRLLSSTTEILAKSPEEPMQAHSFEIRTLIRSLPASPDDHQMAEQFMANCTTCK